MEYTYRRIFLFIFTTNFLRTSKNKTHNTMRKNIKEESFVDNMLGKVASFFNPTIDTSSLDNELKQDTTTRSATPTSPVSIPVRVKKNPSMFDSHSFNHSTIEDDSSTSSTTTTTPTSSSAPTNASSLQYLKDYFGKHCNKSTTETNTDGTKWFGIKRGETN
jgi:hypothetical protein